MDHRGVSNKRLESENPTMSKHYAGKSIAEQNSLGKPYSETPPHSNQTHLTSLFRHGLGHLFGYVSCRKTLFGQLVNMYLPNSHFGHALPDNKFMKLREFLFPTQDDLARFRQILVNVVLATDLFDKEMNDLRRSRWDKAFVSEDTSNRNGLRATIVIEYVRKRMSTENLC